MNNPKSDLEYIKENIKCLPLKDVTFAKSFIEKREFNKLQELVDSALYKISKNLNSDNPKPEYKILDIDAIEELAVKIDSYITKVYGESFKLNAEDLEDDEDYYENNEYFRPEDDVAESKIEKGFYNFVDKVIINNKLNNYTSNIAK